MLARDAGRRPRKKVGATSVKAGPRRRLRATAARTGASAVEQLAPRIAVELRRRDRLAVWEKAGQSPGEHRVWRYVDRHSIDPGHEFELMLAARPSGPSTKGRVQVLRIGHEEAGDRRLVWESEMLTIAAYEATRAGRRSRLLAATAAAVGANWPTTLTVRDTRDWISGYHSIDFVEENGRREADVAFLVPLRSPHPWVAS